MGRDKASFARSIQGHTVILGRIYTVLGWLGLGGAVLLFIQLSSSFEGTLKEGAGTGLLALSPSFALFLLVVWSIILLSFSRDLVGTRSWSTGIGGVLIGCFSLFSVPIGTAVGTYTLWVLYQLHRVS